MSILVIILLTTSDASVFFVTLAVILSIPFAKNPSATSSAFVFPASILALVVAFAITVSFFSVVAVIISIAFEILSIEFLVIFSGAIETSVSVIECIALVEATSFFAILSSFENEVSFLIIVFTPVAILLVLDNVSSKVLFSSKLLAICSNTAFVTLLKFVLFASTTTDFANASATF